jgi:hypothetical protein
MSKVEQALCPRCGGVVVKTFCMVTDERGRDLCQACKPVRYAEIINYLAVQRREFKRLRQIEAIASEMFELVRLLAVTGSGEPRNRAIALVARIEKEERALS